MLRRIKDALSKKEAPTTRSFSVGEVPSTLDALLEESRRELEIHARPHEDRILTVREQLLDQVKELGRVERTEKIHPKLEKITRNSLPQFEKAITTSLAHTLPADPEEFYKAFTESLKGCVKGLAGPGRYLRNVFPDEMKAIRVLIDEMGNEMNHLTPLVAARRARKEQIAFLRDIHHRIGVQSEIKAGAGRAIPPIEARLAETRRTFAERERQLGEQTGSIGEISSLAEREKELGRLNDCKTEDEREIRAILSTLVHVFRKAEKIMQRGEAGILAKQVHLATEVFARAEIPDDTESASHLSAVLPSIISLIESGEILLKNQEEKRLFEIPDRITGILSDLLAKRDEALARIQGCEQQIRDHPLTRRKAAIRDEINSLRASIREDEATLADLNSRLQDAESALPDLLNHLEGGLSKILGNPVIVEPGG